MSLQARGNVLRENKENQKRQNLKAVGNNGKRAALGNVTNQVRRQPLRAAKDKHSLVGCSKNGSIGQENECPSKSNSTGFAIFQDDAVRVPPCNAPVEEKSQDLSCQDVIHIDDELMQDKENVVEEHVLSDAVINLHNRHNGASHQVLQPLRIDVDPIASPMVVDNGMKESKDDDPRDEFGLDPYAADIYDFMRSTELTTRPGLDFMHRQSDVSLSMRNILVDWLVEVGEEYKLHRETLFLSINYIDRFLSLVCVERPKLQLVGAASMFIAAKYEEIYPPDVGEFVYITDDTYNKRQVLKMESVILKLLEFKVSPPTINWFIERFHDNLTDMSDTANFLSFFLAELTLIECEEFMVQRPSVIAASCIVMSRSTLNIHPVWPQHLVRMSGFDVKEILDCVKLVYFLYKRCSLMPQQAVVEKYKQEKFGQVSFVPPPSVLTLL